MLGPTILRRAAVPLLAAAVALTTGCNATKRELTVVFTSGTTDAQREAALHACTGAAPHTSPAPVLRPTPRKGGPPRHISVTFRIDAAGDRDLARLEACLQRQPGVQGFQDSAA